MHVNTQCTQIYTVHAYTCTSICTHSCAHINTQMSPAHTWHIHVHCTMCTHRHTPTHTSHIHTHTHIRQVVVEVNVGRTEVPPKESGVGSEDGGNSTVMQPKQQKPNTSEPLVELGHKERGGARKTRFKLPWCMCLINGHNWWNLCIYSQ